tara:strand:+ start:665 stop:910 length:246 start_codon:yes stop_codon:yes gene_type:complete
MEAVMARKPQPINGENAEEAEARLRDLKRRFSRVSGRYGRRSGPVAGAGGSGGGFSLSGAEWAIVAGLVVFLVVVGAMALG